MSGRPRPPSALALAHGPTLQAVAEHLDDGAWFVEPGLAYDGSDAYLHGPRGEQLHVTFGDGSHRRTDWGRIVFATALPDHLRAHQPHGDPGPSFTVASDRAPQAIAADLRRRLLPAHRAYLATVTRHATRDTEEQARTARLRAELLQILAGHDGRWLDHSQRVRFGRAGDPVEGDARVQAYASTVRFEVAVARDHAPALARVLAALCAHAVTGVPPTQARPSSSRSNSCRGVSTMPADLRNTSLQDRIAPIAVGLGAGWAALLDDRDGEAYLAGPDGERLRVTSDGARLCFRGDLGDAGPHGYGLDNPRACVSASKAPSTIAKDVARRILPKYRAALAEARRRKTESDAADHRRDALVAAIADALGPSVGEVWLDHCGRAHLQLGDYALHEDDVEAQFEIGSGRHPARVTLQVSKDLVVALAAAVDALARQGRCNHDPAALTEVPANRCECGELLPCLADEPAETLPGPAG